MITHGTTRTVILIGKYAIKIPRFTAPYAWSITRGIQANISEREWSGSPGTCPVLYSLIGLINIYPRCQPVTWDMTDDEYDDIGLLGPADRKPNNIGLLNGKLVWVDYDMSWNDCRRCDKE